MVNLTIDGRKVAAPDGATVLEAAKLAGINIPTLCYMKEYNEIGACRICVVEIEGSAKLSAACNTPVSEGISVLTNSERARRARKTNLELILSDHNTRCTSCVRSGNCTLQSLAEDLNITDIPYAEGPEKSVWDKTLPLIRDNSRFVDIITDFLELNLSFMIVNSSAPTKELVISVPRSSIMRSSQS